jgi:hypothetical protein
VDFTSKIYLKYQHQPVLTGLKGAEREAFIKTIDNRVSNHLYDLHPLRKRNYCFLF